MRSRISFIAVLAIAPLPGAVIGSSTPAMPLTEDRVASLPRREKAAWKEYLDRSARQQEADRAALKSECHGGGPEQAVVPPSGSAARSLPMDKLAEWYGGPDALRLADIVVSFQTPAGGWSKNLNLANHTRRACEHFAPNNLSRFLSPGDFDTPRDPHWEYVGTLDNDATTTELRFLARVIAAAPADKAAAYRTAFRKGLGYLFAAQYPNGGWPQVWPLEGGYHDAITFNDGAFTHTLELLRDVAEGKPPYSFVEASQRKQAHTALERGIACIPATQIASNGIKTVWAQQHDPLTLQPVAGRNYEPASQSSSEGASVLLFLMSLPKPDKATISAVRSGAAWLQKSAIHGKAYVRGPDGRRLAAAPDAGPLWARYYAIGSDMPIFGDRDKSIHDTVEEISRERRDGYSWYTAGPKEALDRYAEWSAER